MMHDPSTHADMRTDENTQDGEGRTDCTPGPSACLDSRFPRDTILFGAWPHIVLPDETWTTILEWLGPRDLARIASTCVALCRLANDRRLWERILEADRALDARRHARAAGEYEADWRWAVDETEHDWSAQGAHPRDVYACRLACRRALRAGRIQTIPRSTVLGITVVADAGTQTFWCGRVSTDTKSGARLHRSRLPLDGYGIHLHLAWAERNSLRHAVRYVGTFKNGAYDGHGVVRILRDSDGYGTKCSGRKCPDYEAAVPHPDFCALSDLVGNWAGTPCPTRRTLYAGRWENGKRHGSGLALYDTSSGDRLRACWGEWRRDSLDGRAAFVAFLLPETAARIHPALDCDSMASHTRDMPQGLRSLLDGYGTDGRFTIAFCGKVQNGRIQEGLVTAATGHRFDVMAERNDLYRCTMTAPDGTVYVGQWNAEGYGAAVVADAPRGTLPLPFHKFSHRWTQTNTDAFGRTWHGCWSRGSEMPCGVGPHRVTYPNGDVLVCRCAVGGMLASVVSYTVSPTCADARFAGMVFERCVWRYTPGQFARADDRVIYWPHERHARERADFAAYVRSGLGPWPPIALALYESVL
jgi:hypothetical protein